MRLFLTILILIFITQSVTRANDIREFEIEGFSIGDSLLNHFSKNKIEKEKFFEAEQGKNKEVARFYIREKTGKYDWIAMSFKTSDKRYSIIEITGFVFMQFDKCLKKRDEIDKEIESLFNKSEKQITGNTEHFLDKKTIVNHVAYWTSKKLNNHVSLTCYDWSKQSGYDDQLRIEAISDEYYAWLASLQ